MDPDKTSKLAVMDEGATRIPPTPSPPASTLATTDPVRPKRKNSPSSPTGDEKGLLYPLSPLLLLSAPDVAKLPSTSLPPPTPYPWLWRCHSCGTVYRLGCTRRCLECSHVFCTFVPDSSGKRKRHRGGHPKGPCKAEFDYVGWGAWGAFRRGAKIAAPTNPQQNDDSVARDSAVQRGLEDAADGADIFAIWRLVPDLGETGGGKGGGGGLVWDMVPDPELEDIQRRKEAMFVRGQHDCWLHCDFPSECRHTVYTACKEGRARAAGDGRTALLVGSLPEEMQPAAPLAAAEEEENEQEELIPSTTVLATDTIDPLLIAADAEKERLVAVDSSRDTAGAQTTSRPRQPIFALYTEPVDEQDITEAQLVPAESAATEPEPHLNVCPNGRYGSGHLEDDEDDAEGRDTWPATRARTSVPKTVTTAESQRLQLCAKIAQLTGHDDSVYSLDDISLDEDGQDSNLFRCPRSANPPQLEFPDVDELGAKYGQKRQPASSALDRLALAASAVEFMDLDVAAWCDDQPGSDLCEIDIWWAEHIANAARMKQTYEDEWIDSSSTSSEASDEEQQDSGGGDDDVAMSIPGCEPAILEGELLVSPSDEQISSSDDAMVVCEEKSSMALLRLRNAFMGNQA